MSWIQNLLPSKIRTDGTQKKGVPEGLWSKCNSCQAVRYRAELERNLFVCLKCNFHERLSARERLDILLDDAKYIEIAESLSPVDRLKFKDSKKYKDRISAAQKLTKEKDAMVVVDGHLQGHRVIVAVFNFQYMGGSMGAVVGEKFAQGAMAAVEANAPFICFSASGGARMQEGLFSLMQMAKTSAVLNRLADKQLPYISVLTDPTMGGVSASLAMLGDIIIAEPGALVGFAGPRVIEQTVRQTLPEGFQKSEFLLTHGHIDMVLDRREHRNKISEMLSKMAYMHHIHDA